MRKVFGRLVAFALLVVCAPSAYSQDAREILAKVSETYANLKTYDFIAEAHAAFVVDGVKYGLTLPQELAQGDTPDERMSVLNKLPTFERLDESDQPASPHSFVPPSALFYDFARIAQNLQYAKFLREETQEFNGKKAACYVIEILKIPDVNTPRAPAPVPQTLWIDQTSFLVVRTVFHSTFTGLAAQPARDAQPARMALPKLEMDWDIAFTSYTLNETPPQWMMDMKKNYDQQEAALSAKMVGTSAHAFELQDLGGHEVTLASLHDKVVLLDFWATWCGPCRKELPVLASLEKTWAAKGLVVVRITNEPPEDVQAFLTRTHQTIPTLVNGENVSKQFSVGGIPTLVLLDNAGMIVAYDVDVLSEADLTTRLKKAGLER